LSASQPEESLQETVQQFLTACESHRDGSLPDLEEFLKQFQEPERSSLRDPLQQILSRYEAEAERPSSEATDLSRSEREVDPNSATAAHESVRSDDTVNQESLAGSTVEHLIESSTSDKLASSTSETVEQDPLPDPATPSSHQHDGTADFTRQGQRPAKLKAPVYVAGYEVISVLGRGAMGVVYKARQRGLKRLVALKMILAGKHASEQDLARFRVEANAVAQLQHPGIVQIYEVGEDEGRPFFSLEFVDGSSLHQKLQGMPLPPKEAAALLRKMAEAMAYAHERGVIHRDLKPANVLMTSTGLPKIGDFGLAKTINEEESGLTRTGAVLGTPSYMCPEQASGLTHEIGPLADVYSLGAILYDMLTGRPPFRGTSVMDTLQQLRTREPVPPVQLQPGVPRDLETICLKCLQKDRHKRYESASALAADLQRFLNNEPIVARPISWVERSWRWCRRNPGKAITAANVTLGLLAWMVSVTVLALLLQEEKTAALQAKGEAETNEVIAKAQTKLAEEKTALANQKTIEANRQTEIALKETESQRRTSEESLKGMIVVVRKVYEALQSKRLSTDASPEIRKLRAEMLAEVRQSLADVVQRINAAATATYVDLRAAELVGTMLMKLGQSAEPRKIFEEALVAAKRRVELQPENDRSRGNLGIIEQHLGDVALEMEGDARTAKVHFQACRKLHEEIQQHPRSGEYSTLEINRALAHDDVHLGRSLLALGQAEEAQRYFEEARKYFEEWLRSVPPVKNSEPRSRVSEVQMWLGIAAGNRGDAKSIQQEFGKALEIGRELLKEFPDAYWYKADQAELLMAHGDALLKIGKLGDAKVAYLEAQKFLQAVVAKKPDDNSYQPLIAALYEKLGIVSNQLNEEKPAKDYFKAALQLRKQLYEIEPSNLARQIGYVLALARSGERENAVRLTNTIRSRMEKSPELMFQVARCYAILSQDKNADRQNTINQALSALEIGTRHDFKDATILLMDPELTPLREEPKFQELIAKIKGR
jgi:serine/threonine-protein kinase